MFTNLNAKSGTILLALTLGALFLLAILAGRALRPLAAGSAPAPPFPAAGQDRSLAQMLAAHGVEPLDLGPPADPDLVALGEALFFDKELSGNRDISCATCHHPQLASGDGRPLPAGTGGRGLGPARTIGAGREMIPRSAPELFNRGAPAWETMFWDGRVFFHAYDGAEDVAQMESPADEQLPEGLTSPLAAQALFPPTSRDEMRGQPGETAADGRPNELAEIPDGDFEKIWQGLLDRLLAIPGYQELFARAYPETALGEIGPAHFGNALAAYQAAAFSFDDAPWDRYLDGQAGALSDEAKQGALLFYGRAGCAACHAGPLLTNQQFYNLGVPQLGPGKDPSGFDLGRFLETREDQDLFAFRTPPLRNVTLTAPYMHNGVYATLEETIRHHLDPLGGLQRYSGVDLSGEVRITLRDDPHTLRLLARTVSPEIKGLPPLTDEEIELLLAFLESLTSPSAADLSYLVPAAVPSGLTVNEE